MDSVKGQLLVAAPQLQDPNFARSVVLMVDHGDEGALGVVLNRATETRAAEAADELSALIGDEEPLHVGGPVQTTAIVVVAEFPEEDPAAVIATGSIGLLSSEADMGEVAERIGRARAFAGFAGWGPGQLDEELEREDWILAPAGPNDVFTADPEGLWGVVLERLGPQYALVARMPPDPSLN
ncbi:MAG: YqgE/AlgH family protein [Thermoleophilaceae bacterium]|nr:YqgE/AlgH family protein [Thermoleophilaceae bacterium]